MPRQVRILRPHASALNAKSTWRRPSPAHPKRRIDTPAPFWARKYAEASWQLMSGREWSPESRGRQMAPTGYQRALATPVMLIAPFAVPFPARRPPRYQCGRADRASDRIASRPGRALGTSNPGRFNVVGSRPQWTTGKPISAQASRCPSTAGPRGTDLANPARMRRPRK